MAETAVVPQPQSTTTVVPTLTPETPPVDPTKVDPAKVEEKAELPSKRQAMLAQRERRLSAQEAELKRVESELEKRVVALEQFERTKGSAKTNPLEYLKAAGLSYEDIVEYMSSGKPTQDAILSEAKAEVQKLRDEQEADKKKVAAAQTEAQKKQEAEAVNKFKADTVEKVKAAGEKYELLNHFESQHEVGNLIEAYYYQTGKLLTWEEGADLCEKELSEQLAKAEAVLKKRSEKVPEKKGETKGEQKKVEQAGEKKALSKQERALAVLKGEKPTEPQQSAPKTLTNEDATTSGAANKKLTPAERRARAIAVLGGGR